jgi:uncharacterized membrane protein
MINSVFIGFVAYLFSKALMLRAPSEAGADQGKVRRRHVVLTIVAVLVFVTPSLFIAYDVVRESDWRAKLAQFEQANLVFPDTQVVSTKVVQQGNARVLEVALVGPPLSADLKAHLSQQLDRYGLSGLTIKFVQPTSAGPSGPPATEAPSVATVVAEVTREVNVLFPSLANLAWGDLATQTPTDAAPRTQATAFARWSVEPAPAEKERLAAFLRLRLQRPDLNLVHETLTPEAKK